MTFARLIPKMTPAAPVPGDISWAMGAYHSCSSAAMHSRESVSYRRQAAPINSDMQDVAPLIQSRLASRNQGLLGRLLRCSLCQ